MVLPMKVLAFGDVHGLVRSADIPAIEVIVDVVKRTDADLILQVGDLGGYRPFIKPVHWIFGNNDSITLTRACLEGKPPVKNLIHVKTGEVLRFSSGGETIALSGLNGAYDPIYFDYQKDELDNPGFFTRQDVENCLGLRNIDIFLAHGCPSGLGFGREPDHGNPSIREILDSVKPRYLLCGHGHFYRRITYGPSTVVSLDEVRQAYYIIDTASGDIRTFQTDPSTIPEKLGLRYTLRESFKN
jgi:Icc-related predicted phosphoesterase